MHYLHFEKGYFQLIFHYFQFKMQVMYFPERLFQKLLEVKNVKVQPAAGIGKEETVAGWPMICIGRDCPAFPGRRRLSRR